MEEMQQHNMSWIEVCNSNRFSEFFDTADEEHNLSQQCLLLFFFQVQFLRKAVDVLCLCRNTLKYTYVFAFYLKKNNQSVIFEVNNFISVISCFSKLWTSNTLQLFHVKFVDVWELQGIPSQQVIGCVWERGGSLNILGVKIPFGHVITLKFSRWRLL